MTALGKDFLDGTVLEALLPVELSGADDIRQAKDGRLVARDEKLAALIGTAPLATKFYQQVKVKPGAEVLLATGDGDPLLICWPYGAGHVSGMDRPPPRQRNRPANRVVDRRRLARGCWRR